MKAKRIEEELASFKDLVEAEVGAVVESMAISNDTDGLNQKNFEFSSFDGSVTIKKVVTNPISWDTEKYHEAMKALNNYLDTHIFVEEHRQLIMHAANSPNMIMFRALEATVDIIKDDEFSMVVKMLRESLAQKDEVSYFRVYENDAEGKPRMINLSLSKV